MSREFATNRTSLDNLLLLRDPSSFSESSSLCAGPETGRSGFYRRRPSPPSLSPHTSSLGRGPMCPELLGRVGCISFLPTLTTLLTGPDLTTLLTGPEGGPDKLFFSFPQLGCPHQRLEISSCPKVSQSPALVPTYRSAVCLSRAVCG